MTDRELPAEGTNYGTITGAEQKQSRAGNDMIVVTIRLENNLEVTDYIVFTPAAEWKQEAVRKALNISEVTPEALRDRTVAVDIDHEETEKYGKQARVSGWAAWVGDSPEAAAQFAADEEEF